MLLYTTHTYTNTRNDGKKFFHETKDRAVTAAEMNKDEYDEIAVHTSTDTRRCDPCLAEGKFNPAFSHKETKQDLCSDHRKALEKQLAS